MPTRHQTRPRFFESCCNYYILTTFQVMNLPKLLICIPSSKKKEKNLGFCIIACRYAKVHKPQNFICRKKFRQVEVHSNLPFSLSNFYNNKVYVFCFLFNCINSSSFLLFLFIHAFWHYGWHMSK